MKSDIIMIDNQGKGFSDAVKETQRVARYAGLDRVNTLHLQLLTEEMLSLARNVTGEMKASFWLESESGVYSLHMSTNAVLDTVKREELIASTTSRKNDAAKSFLGLVRDAFERAMAADKDYQPYEFSSDELEDLVGRDIELPEWDGYERSVLAKLADEVRIGIKGQEVQMTVTKRFAK